VLPLALLEQALQPAEEVMLLAPTGTAARTGIAAARTSVARRLGTTVASTTPGLAASSTGITAGLAASSTGIAAGLTTRRAALAAEHPIEELETEGLATNGDAQNQRTEKHHTLHRATSPLLADHVRVLVPVLRFITPRL